MKFITCFIFTAHLFSCSDNGIHSPQTLQNFQDSILFQSIKTYYDYLDSEISEDNNYAIYIESYRSSDTISFLINCNESDEIYTIMIHNFKHVYQIGNHNVFSKEKIFSFEGNQCIDSALKSMNKEDYEYYIQNGTTPHPPAIWDCKFLYLVINKHDVIRNEIRFYDSSQMFKNDF
jgi:hypothetical protein